MSTHILRYRSYNNNPILNHIKTTEIQMMMTKTPWMKSPNNYGNHSYHDILLSASSKFAKLPAKLRLRFSGGCRRGRISGGGCGGIIWLCLLEGSSRSINEQRETGLERGHQFVSAFAIIITHIFFFFTQMPNIINLAELSKKKGAIYSFQTNCWLKFTFSICSWFHN